MGHWSRRRWPMFGVDAAGTARSRTSRVLAIAKMPSLNASILEVRRLSTRRRSAGPGSLIRAASHSRPEPAGPGARRRRSTETAQVLAPDVGWTGIIEVGGSEGNHDAA